MNPRLLPAAFLGLALTASPVLLAQTPAQNPQSAVRNPQSNEFEFRGGRWVPVPTDAPTTLPTDQNLDRAEDFLRRGGWRAARKVLLDWFDSHDRNHPLRDRATFLFAEVYYTSGHRILAFYHFDEVMDLYPESRLYSAALQRQYDIADAFLKGYKSRLLYLPIIGREDEAVEMLFRVQSRAPGSPIAEKSLLRTADFYYATSQFDFAADAYGEYVKRYPRSPLAGRVKLRQAFSQMAQFRGTRFDASPALDARELLSDLVITEPDLAQQEALPVIVNRIDDALARKLLHTADFYRRTDKPRGAAYLYRLMLATYPDSPDAPEARRRLAALPQTFLDDPAPTTQPQGPDSNEFVPPSTPSTPSTGPATRLNGAGQ
jgi:outer membrane assembly lipoprotein YfiO